MLTDIRLQNFRSYKDASFELGNKVNIIVGPNTSGKTNLLEAILVASCGRSYRGNEEQLVKEKSSWSRVDMHTKNDTRTLKINPSKNQKEYEIDLKTYKKLPLDKQIPAVLFEPGNLRLISGEPALRREFIDSLLEQIDAEFGLIASKYQRALRQRNALLKKGVAAAAKQLFAWDLRLSELGGQVVKNRLGLIEKLNKNLSRTYSGLAGKKFKTSVDYTSSVDPKNYSTQMLKKLEEQRELDFLRGFTGAGPHRDDLIFNIDKHRASEFASRGEVRTLILALKIIELKLIEKARNQKPILLLDDVFSELDGKRRRAVTELVKTYQTFITTTDADIVAKQFSQKCNLIAL